MEIFGGFMVMLSILGFFLTVIWFVMPFVVLAVKGKVDRTLELVEEMDRRLAAIEKQLARPPVSEPSPSPAASGPDIPPYGSPPPSVEG